MGVDLHFNKLEFPFTQGCSLLSMIKIGPTVLEKEDSMYFHYYLPLEEDVDLHLNKLESASPKDALCLVWL